MFKDGHKYMYGLDEAVLKNIDLASTFPPSLGMNKMVINHLDKLFVTNDAGTIVKLKVQHPDAKLLVFAGKAQQEEIGDGANLMYPLLWSEIISGYLKSSKKATEVLDELVEKDSDKMDVRNEEVISRMLAAVASKQFGQENILCLLIADTCIQVCPKNPTNLNVDNIRVAKLLGGGLHNSTIVRRMDAVWSIKKVERAKVAVFVNGVETSATETKGTVLVHNAEQLETCALNEEVKVEELIKAVADSGAKVIVSGGAAGEMALHFCERTSMHMVLKIASKFKQRRFCRTTGAVAMLKLGQPNADDLGYVDSVSVEEIGGARGVYLLMR